jgi:shikimate 5-dehydrogenase
MTMTDSNPPSRITPRIDFARELAGLNDLRGQVALVPGGYGGIGEAIAWTLVLAGASVMIAGRSAAKAEAWRWTRTRSPTSAPPPTRRSTRSAASTFSSIASASSASSACWT